MATNFEKTIPTNKKYKAINNHVYRNNWQDPEFIKLFIGFKQFISSSEQDCARQCADIVTPQLKSQNISILDLGAGDGTVSLAFLEKLNKQKTILDYTAIDVSQDLVNILKSKEKYFKQITQHVHIERTDAAEFAPPGRYDLIIAFCSWFGIPFQEILRYLFLLAPGGILAITLSSRDSITIDLPNHFIEPVYSADDLSHWLTSVNIYHTRHEIISQSLERDDFLHGEQTNPKADKFFKYLMRGPNGNMEDIVSYISQKSDHYFKTPKDLIVLKEDSIWITGGNS